MYDLTLDGVIACLQDKGNKCTQPELQAAFKVMIPPVTTVNCDNI